MCFLLTVVRVVQVGRRFMRRHKWTSGSALLHDMEHKCYKAAGSAASAVSHNSHALNSSQARLDSLGSTYIQHPGSEKSAA